MQPEGAHVVIQWKDEPADGDPLPPEVELEKLRQEIRDLKHSMASARVAATPIGQPPAAAAPKEHHPYPIGPSPAEKPAAQIVADRATFVYAKLGGGRVTLAI